MCPTVAEFLVRFLEQEVCRLNWDVGFVTSTMLEIGLQLPRLLEVYDQLFKTRVGRFFSTMLKLQPIVSDFDSDSNTCL